MNTVAAYTAGRSPSVKLSLLRVGACRHLECVAARGGRLALVNFPSLSGLIRHPTRGWILYDTGYAEHFFTATATFPERLCRVLLPVDLPANEVLLKQLELQGIKPTDIALVIISHYHGDHIAGLRDFPNAQFISLRTDAQIIESLRGRRLKSTWHSQFHSLLPDDFTTRLSHADDSPVRQLPLWMAPFEQGFDLLGDGSLLGIPLPGHSAGQLGLLLPDAEGRPVFLVGDACWSITGCLEGRLPLWLAMLFNADRARYRETYRNLGTLGLRESALALLPSHCTTAWTGFQDARA